MSEKLTKAQHLLLVDLDENESAHCVPEYRPAQKLVALGFAVWKPFNMLAITEAGRAALNRSGDE